MLITISHDLNKRYFEPHFSALTEAPIVNRRRCCRIVANTVLGCLPLSNKENPNLLGIIQTTSCWLEKNACTGPVPLLSYLQTCLFLDIDSLPFTQTLNCQSMRLSVLYAFTAPLPLFTVQAQAFPLPFPFIHL